MGEIFRNWCQTHGYSDVYYRTPNEILDQVDVLKAAVAEGRYYDDLACGNHLDFACWLYRHGRISDGEPIPRCRALTPSLIECRPGVQGGEPVVRGTRTPVRSVAVLWEVYSGDLAKIGRALRHLSSEEIAAALAYYHQHREEIDLAIAENEAGA